jgi:Zn-dependent protease
MPAALLYSNQRPPASGRGRTNRVPGTIRLGRILGIPIAVNPTWYLLLILVVSFLGTQGFGDLPAWQAWPLALATAALFFLSLVLHELGHSVVARYFGIPVRSITLFALGAIAQTTRESRRAGHEFLLAVAGPAVSILIAGLFMVLWLLTRSLGTPFSRVCWWLWLMNFSVGMFNMTPAFPMDGGRVLRSALWGIMGNWRRATHWAALVGRGIAFALIGVGFLIALQLPGVLEEFGQFNGVQFILLGVFISYAARQSDLHSGVLDALSRFRVGDVMVRDIPAVLATTTVAEALAGPLAGYGAARDWLLVSTDERFAGLAPRAALQSVPEERQYATCVLDVAIPAAGLRATGANDRLDDILQRMDSEQIPLFVVVDDGQVAGVIHRGQVMAAALGRRRAGGG